MSKTNKTEQSKKEILKALEQSLGIVTTACRSTSTSRTQFYQWIKDDKDFEKAVKDVENISFDFVESQLFKLIKEGSAPSTIFFCKTKMKDRGYVERQEFTGKDGKELNISPIDWIGKKSNE